MRARHVRLFPLLCAFVTGCQFGFADDTGPDAGTEVETAAEVLWAEQWGQDATKARGQAIAADPTGGFVHTGVVATPSYSQLGVQRHHENGDYVMHAFDLYCSVAPCTPDLESSVAVGSDGSTYTAGAFQGPAVLATPAGNLHAGPSAVTSGFVLKLDSAQQYRWTYTLGGFDGRMRPDDLVVIPGGDVAVVGAYSGSRNVGGAILPDTVGERGFLVCLNSEGVVRWARALGELKPGERMHVSLDIGSLVVTDRVSGALTLSYFSLDGQPAGSLAQDLRMLESVRDLTSFPAGGALLVGRYLTGPATGSVSEHSVLMQIKPERAAGWTLTSPAQMHAAAPSSNDLLVSGDFRGTLQLGEQRYPAGSDFPSIFAARVSLEGKLLSVRILSAQGEGELSVRSSALLRDGASVHAGYFTAPMKFETGNVTLQAPAKPEGTGFFLKLAP
jgi:hypothetical protein